MKLSVVIPTYNEQDNVPLLHTRLTAVMDKLEISEYEFIFVNDGSRDHTFARIVELSVTDPHVKYIDFSRNFGHQIAVTAGLDVAEGEAVVIIDADLQDPPEVIESLYEKYQEGYEVVYARRRKRKGESWFKKVTAKWFYRILARITSIDIPIDTGDFRLIDQKVVKVLRQMPEQNKYLRGQIAWIGFRQTDVLYDRHSRHTGETGYSIGKMLRFALDGITAFSDLPLRVATLSGFFVSGISFLLMIYALLSRFVWQKYVVGWTSIILCVLFIGGIQLICLGIIGEYINRISVNVRQRPLYVIRKSKLDTTSKK